MQKMTWLALATAAALSLTACGQNETSSATAKNPPSAEQSKTDAAPTALLTDATALQAAEDSLKALPQFSGKNIHVFKTIWFYGGKNPRIEVSIQNPDKPDNIDKYEYKDGKWGEPQPVQISGNGKISDYVFPLSEIKFVSVVEMTKTYAAKAKEVGAIKTEPTMFYYIIEPAFNQKRWITESVETEREKYGIEFNTDGTLKDFKKK